MIGDLNMQQEISGQRGATYGKFQKLFVALEDLLKRVADSEDPNIRRMRAQVRAELIAIQSDMSPVIPAF